MAYPQVQPINLVGDYLQGRQVAHQERAMKQRNALAEMDMQQQQRFNALSQDPNASPEQFARMGRSDVANALTNQRQFDHTSKMQAVQQLGTIAQRALDLDPPSRKAFVQQAVQMYGSAFQALGADPAKGLAELQNLPDAELEQRLRQVAAFGPQAKQAEGFTLGEGQVRYDAQGRPIARGPAKTRAEGAQWRYLTPDEIRQRGLPEGTSAQMDASTGKVDVINKREGLSAAEQKTIREAKMRMPRLNATMRRVDRIEKALNNIEKNWVADGGRLDQYALSWTKEGQELQAAIAQLQPELMALTRVPGIGSQSDLEARQAELALPSLNFGPDVNRRSLAELKSFVGDLRSAYESILSGNTQESAPPAPTESVPSATGPNGQKIYFRNGKWGP